MSTEQEYLQYVSDELFRIRASATTSEIDGVKFENLSPSSGGGTIYGLLTGNYNTDRAKDISPKIYRYLDGDSNFFMKGDVVTALEKYMDNQPNARRAPHNEEIINFIKGRVSTLTLKYKDYTLNVGGQGSKRPFEIHKVKEFKF